MDALELFSGAGGLAIGLENSGFTLKLLVEADPIPCKTLAHNQTLGFFPDAAIAPSSVSSIDFSPYVGVIDLLAAGPPCQPFSIGGNRLGPDDDRSAFDELISAIAIVRPRAFLIENVLGMNDRAFKGYLRYLQLQLARPQIHCGTKTWQEQRGFLESDFRSKAIYDVYVETINAADVGVPQIRKRVFLIGFDSSMGTSWKLPKPLHSRFALLREQHDETSYWARNRVRVSERVGPTVADGHFLRRGPKGPSQAPMPWRTVREALQGLPSPAKVQSRRFTDHVFHPGARIYPGHTGSFIDYPAKAVKAGVHGTPGGENMIRYADDSVRYFTIRELARLQTFPDEYEFVGTRSQKVRQLGNAVPVQVAEWLALSVRNALGS